MCTDVDGKFAYKILLRFKCNSLKLIDVFYWNNQIYKFVIKYSVEYFESFDSCE